MCDFIIARNCKGTIETVRQFRQYFGTSVEPAHPYTRISPDACLCQIDIPVELNKTGYQWKHEEGDNHYVVNDGLSRIK